MNDYLYTEKSMKLVTKLFECDNLIKSYLSNITGSNELFFYFITNSIVITVLSDMK